MIPIYTVCTGPNYFPHHANRFLRQLRDYVDLPLQLHCYTTYDRHDFDTSIEVIPIANDDGRRQWHKVDLFKIVPQNQVCFISDLDWTFLNDVTDVFNQPVQHNEFIAPYRWWARNRGKGFNINGGLYKFIGGQYTFIPDVFHTNPRYWMQRYIIDLEVANPPINGEQNFVDEILQKHNVTISYFNPEYTIARCPINTEHAVEFNMLYESTYGKEWCWMGGEFHSDVRMVHTILDS
jgi:hypothetical protein